MISLRGRLLGVLLPALLMVTLAAAASGYVTAGQRIGGVLDRNLAENARVLLLWVLAEPRGGDEVDPDNVERELRELFSDVARSASARPAAATAAAAAPRLEYAFSRAGVIARVASTPLLGELDACEQPGFRRVRAGDGRDWYVYTAAGGEAPAAVVCVAQRSGERRALILSMLLPSLAWWGLVLPLSAVVVWLGVRRGLRPLAGIAAELRARAPNDLAPLRGAGPAEVQPLLVAMNDLLVRQRHLIEQERRFSAEAAHELRTPLTTVRLQAEQALADLGVPDAAAPSQPKAPGSAAATAAALRGIIAESDRAGRVLAQLLTLARVDAADAHGVVLEPVALLPLLRDLLAEQADEALGRGQELLLTGAERVPAGAAVAAEPVSLRLLLRNLVDNAIRYTPPGGRITVHVEPIAAGAPAGREGDPAGPVAPARDHPQPGDALRVSIVDTGPGIAPERRRELCEPFRRGDRHDTLGSGLGLTIARRIASLHGTRLQMAEGPGGLGLEVAISLVRSR